MGDITGKKKKFDLIGKKKGLWGIEKKQKTQNN